MQDRASFTAETVALMRALETHRGSGRRLFVDPFADAFTSGRLRFLARWSRIPVVGAIAHRVYDWVAGPGPRPSAVARTRFIDDAVTERASVVDQLVLLGAGFDTRAHRLPAVRALTTFEVDHPATQARKVAIVAGEGIDARGVVYVPVDFERDRLDTELLAVGFDPGRPAIFVWEGVTNYLTAGAVDATLAVIRDARRAEQLARVHLRPCRGDRRIGPVPGGGAVGAQRAARRRAVDVRGRARGGAGVPPRTVASTS